MAKTVQLKPVVVAPDEGRVYEMGAMKAIFKTDLEQTDNQISISQWCLEPNTPGPEIHQHPEAHVFYVLSGELSVYLPLPQWFKAPEGTTIFIPSDTPHGFDNKSQANVSFIAINTPGGFEANMPNIVEYIKAQAPI